MRILAAVLSLGLLCAAAACKGGSEPEGKKLSDAQLSALVLRPGDVGRKLQQFADGRSARIELNPVLDGDPARFGRQDGWTARYRSTAKNPAGLLTLVSTVDVFGKPSGAKDFFAAAAKHDGEVARANGMKRVDVRKLGDELQAEATASSSPGSVRSVTITWRAGRFVAGLSASGLDPDPSIEVATALARKQLARLQRAD